MASQLHAVLMTEDDVTFKLVSVAAQHRIVVLKPEGPTAIENAQVSLGDRIALGSYQATVAELLALGGRQPQIFISYSRQDRDRSKVIAERLAAQGLRVWWDDQLQVARPFDDQLEEQIKGASLVAVLWSEQSVKSQWVRAEAGVALERNALLPVFIERVEPPLLFRQIQGHFVTSWGSSALKDELNALATKIDALLKIDRGGR
jgi:hypothetical protein